MCLAVPVRVEKILEDQMVVVELDGVKREVSTALLDDVKLGDYLVIHVGYALSKLSEEEALKTLELIAQGDAP